MTDKYYFEEISERELRDIDGGAISVGAAVLIGAAGVLSKENYVRN